MFRNILPKEPIFFDYFEQHIDLVITLTQEVLNMANASPSAWEQHAKKVKDLEHEMDIIAHGCIEILHKSFITPIDRSDIFTLMKRMDSIANNLNGAVARMIMYNISEIRPEVKEFARILIAAENEIKKALAKVTNTKKRKGTLKEALEGADVFIGVSKGNLLTSNDFKIAAWLLFLRASESN